MPANQKITTFLSFKDSAEEAARFYTSVFKSSKIVDVARYPAGAPLPEGSVMTVTFQIEGQEFIALNGGPHGFNQAISLFVHCDSQQEVDDLWAKLTDGGQEVACGWLKDKYGLSWQIVPRQFMEMVNDTTDPTRRERVFAAMMQMTKLDLARLQQAYAGKS